VGRETREESLFLGEWGPSKRYESGLARHNIWHGKEGFWRQDVRTVQYGSAPEQLSVESGTRPTNAANQDASGFLCALPIWALRICTIRKPCLSVSTTRNHTGHCLLLTLQQAISQFVVAHRLHCDCANFESQPFYFVQPAPVLDKYTELEEHSMKRPDVYRGGVVGRIWSVDIRGGAIQQGRPNLDQSAGGGVGGEQGPRRRPARLGKRRARVGLGWPESKTMGCWSQCTLVANLGTAGDWVSARPENPSERGRSFYSLTTTHLSPLLFSTMPPVFTTNSSPSSSRPPIAG